MPRKKVKTRFAPSPTGMMHVGNFRTALFTYLIARKHHGKFVLRIEDTDQKRVVEGAEELIFKILKWANLQHDEGPDIGGPEGPYRQSERLDIYHKYIHKLIDNGQAYYCFCSPQRLDKMRAEQQAMGEITKYDGHCLNLEQKEIQQKLEAGEPYVIRQRIDQESMTQFHDLVHGTIEIDNSQLDDTILIKSDGYPTYNFANVIDDHLMGITHIVRGEEYISSTPKYLQLYQAFNWRFPEHIHLPLILGKNKSKLSKRDGDVAMSDYIDKGYLPESLINFVVLLGWNPGDDQELFTLQELIQEFDFEKINKSGAVFDLTKLDWMNGHYIRHRKISELTELCIPYLKQVNYIDDELYIKHHDLAKHITGNKSYIQSVVGLEQERLKKLSELPEKVDYFFNPPQYKKQLLIWKKSNIKTTKQRLQFLIDYLNGYPEKNWTRQALQDSLMGEIKRQGYGNGDTLWPMRAALSGKDKSPSPFEIAEVLGKAETLMRLKQALEKIG